MELNEVLPNPENMETYANPGFANPTHQLLFMSNRGSKFFPWQLFYPDNKKERENLSLPILKPEREPFHNKEMKLKP